MIEDDVARLRDYVFNASDSGNLRLPSEPKLGDALGVSRGRLRTMLKRLEEEGLIWRHVGKGTFVGARQVALDDVNWSASISVDDVIDARLLLEPQLAAQAAIHATPADIVAMERCMVEMTATTTFLQWKRLDDKLHRAVAEATHNMLLLVLYDTLSAQAKLSLEGRMKQIFGALSGPKQTTEQEHASFIAAIRERDPTRAEQTMREHLLSVRTSLFGLR